MGSAAGGRAAAIAYTLIETAKLNDVDPKAWLTQVLDRSYVRKLVTELSGGVFGYLDSVLERHSFDEFGELI